MKKTNVLIGALVLGLLSTSVSAEDDSCSEVLLYSARDYSVEKSDIGIAVKVYDQYCKDASVNSGTNFDAGVEAVIKAVPLKFNLGSGSTKQRTEHFCKTFNSEYKKNEKYFRQTSQVVRETTSAWLSCKNFVSKGLIFRPQIARTQILVEIERKAAQPISVQGVQYDHKLLACTVPNSDTSKYRGEANSKTTKALEAGSWTITCTRLPQELAGETVYREADISVGTTKGPFLLPVAADAVFPYQWASDLQKQLASTNSKLSDVSSQLDLLSKKAKIIAMITVSGGKIVSRSEGVTFNKSTGVITFPNPDNSKFVPLVSDFSGKVAYLTGTNFIREISGPNKFKVWRTPLDTGNRHSAPSDFSAVVVGL